MNKKLLATSIALTFSIAAPSANAAFTFMDAGNYTMSITGGCYGISGNCQLGSGSLTDNTLAEATTTAYPGDVTTRPVGSTIGSGIAGDGLMGEINFSVNASGDMTITTYSQDSYTQTIGGISFIDALGIDGTSAMTGNISATGAMSFTPTGREILLLDFVSTIGVQEWNRDSQSGLYDTFTTGVSTNRSSTNALAYTMTGTALSDDGAGGWTATLVSAGNLDGSKFIGYNETRYSELWDISITAAHAVPVPAAAWLFGSGLLGLIGVARRKHKRCE